MKETKLQIVDNSDAEGPLEMSTMDQIYNYTNKVMQTGGIKQDISSIVPKVKQRHLFAEGFFEKYNDALALSMFTDITLATTIEELYLQRNIILSRYRTFVHDMLKSAINLILEDIKNEYDIHGCGAYWHVANYIDQIGSTYESRGFLSELSYMNTFLNAFNPSNCISYVELMLDRMIFDIFSDYNRDDITQIVYSYFDDMMAVLYYILNVADEAIGHLGHYDDNKIPVEQARDICVPFGVTFNEPLDSNLNVQLRNYPKPQELKVLYTKVDQTKE